MAVTASDIVAARATAGATYSAAVETLHLAFVELRAFDGACANVAAAKMAVEELRQNASLGPRDPGFDSWFKQAAGTEEKAAPAPGTPSAFDVAMDRLTQEAIDQIAAL